VERLRVIEDRNRLRNSVSTLSQNSGEQQANNQTTNPFAGQQSPQVPLGNRQETALGLGVTFGNLSVSETTDINDFGAPRGSTVTRSVLVSDHFGNFGRAEFIERTRLNFAGNQITSPSGRFFPLNYVNTADYENPDLIPAAWRTDPAFLEYVHQLRALLDAPYNQETLGSNDLFHHLNQLQSENHASSSLFGRNPRISSNISDSSRDPMGMAEIFY
jgi:hypothetical protein